MMPLCEHTGLPILYCEHCDDAAKAEHDWASIIKAHPEPEPALRRVGVVAVMLDQPADPRRTLAEIQTATAANHTLDQLEAIPRLVHLVTESADAPARERSSRSGGKIGGSPMPNAVGAEDLMRDVQRSLAECVRVVVEELRANDQWEPTPGEPSIDGDCGYLTETADVWRGDAFANEWVRANVRVAYRSLARWVGEQQAKPVRYECPACRGTLHRDSYSATDDGQSLGCEDCGKLVHPKEVAHLAAMHTPGALADIAAMLDVTERTVRRWVSAGLVRPTTTHAPTKGKPDLYLPYDVARLKGMMSYTRVIPSA